MGDEYSKDLCYERHRVINENVSEIKILIEKLFNRLNWFYLIVIAGLGGLSTALIQGCGG